MYYIRSAIEMWSCNSKNFLCSEYNVTSLPTKKMVKHTQTICWLLPTNCLSVFEHFVGLTLKVLIHFRPLFPFYAPWKHQKAIFFREIWKQNIGLKWVSILNWQLSAPFWNLLFRKNNCLQSPHEIIKKWTECKAKLRNFQGCITHRRNFI